MIGGVRCKGIACRYTSAVTPTSYFNPAGCHCPHVFLHPHESRSRRYGPYGAPGMPPMTGAGGGAPGPGAYGAPGYGCIAGATPTGSGVRLV